jgi:hypothetical protein
VLLVGLGGPTYRPSLRDRVRKVGGWGAGGGTYGPGTATRKQTPIVFTRFSKKLSHDEHSCEFLLFSKENRQYLRVGKVFLVGSIKKQRITPLIFI